MKHPITGKNVFYYYAFWLIVALSMVGFGYFFYQRSLKWLVLDAFIFFNTVAISFYFMWYPFRYFSPQFMSIPMVVLNHLLVMGLLISANVSLSFFVVSQVLKSDQAYFTTMAPLKFVLVVFSYIVFVLFIQVFEAFKKNKEQKENELILESNLKEAELAVLRNQLNPHFLFNSLNSINALILLDSTKAREMVVKLSDFLRYNLTNAQTKKVKLCDELAMCRSFLDIEKIRFGNKISIGFDIAPATENISVPGLLLQPLFENALKHGLYNSTETEHIKLKSSLVEGKLLLEMQNSYDTSFVKKIGTKSGLKNISKRLSLMYGSGATITTYTATNVFYVKVYIPYD
jgi:two-component system, LytTR family, sensor kinase